MGLSHTMNHHYRLHSMNKSLYHVELPNQSTLTWHEIIHVQSSVSNLQQQQ